MLHNAKQNDDLTDVESIRRSRLAAEIKLLLADANITIDPGILSQCLCDDTIDWMHSLLTKMNHSHLLTKPIIKQIFAAPLEYLRIYAALNQHANMIHLLFAHNISLEDVKVFSGLLLVNEVSDGECHHLRMYESRSWLTDNIFILIVNNFQHASVIIPIFLKYQSAHQLLEKDNRNNRSFDVLNTLICMARVGIRLDSHNAKVAFVSPLLGRAYELCEENGCLVETTNILRMPPIEVMRHLSQNQDLVDGLVELREVYLMAAVMKVNIKNANIKKEIAMLFDASFDDAPAPAQCLGLFARRAEPPTIRSILDDIRAKYHINEMMLSPRI